MHCCTDLPLVVGRTVTYCLIKLLPEVVVVVAPAAVVVVVAVVFALPALPGGGEERGGGTMVVGGAAPRGWTLLRFVGLVKGKVPSSPTPPPIPLP